MDYYELKRKAYMDIDAMLEKGTLYDSIVFKIATRYGLGESIIKHRIEMLKKVKRVKDVSQ